MIYLYSGTPGSGKSLHVARLIYYTLFRNKPVICNFPIDTGMVKHPDKFLYIDNSELNPKKLMDYSREHFSGRPVREGEILLVIDECQMMFNARNWDAKGREAWNKFFTLHRHFGYDIVLVAQFDRMIDRQIRCLIEYEQVHRKVTNYGWKGWLICAFMLSPSLFVSVKIWYPMKERVSSDFFRAKKKYYQLYDTYAVFESDKGSGRGTA